MCYTTIKDIYFLLECGENVTRTVLVTGASGDIGKKCALAFAALGYNIVIHYYNNKEAAMQLQNEINSSKKAFSIAVCANLADSDSVSEMFHIIKKNFGGVDILINNAGISQIKMFSDISEEDWDNMFDINVKSIYSCCRHVLPYMINNKYGKIINISSIWGICGASCEVHYSAAKAAVIGFTKALAKELGPSGIQVNCIAPGVIDTRMNAHLGEDTLSLLKEETPLGRLGLPEDIASCVVFLASDNAGFITGQVISPNGGYVI